MSEEKTLWLKNTSGLDINLSDLGVKVPMSKTVNVYKANPYLSEEQVQKSLESGAIYKKLQAQTLQVVLKPVSERPHGLDHIKATNKAMNVVKTKSSVVVDTKEMDVLNDDDLGGIADYGFEEDAALKDATSNVRTDDGSVVVRQKKDDPDTEKSDAVVNLKQVASASNVDAQSVVAMAQQVESQTNPVGPISEAVTPPAPKSHVVQPPVDEEKAVVVDIKEPSVGKQEDGSVAVAGKTPGGRSLKAAKELNKLADEMGVDVENLPKEVIEKYDADQVIQSEPTPYDLKVATKDKTGAVVMKLKEEVSESKKDE